MEGNQKLKEGKITIRELFEQNKDIQFMIPPYQRAYSWREKEITDFYNDIRDQPNEDQSESHCYYLGHYLFEHSPENDNVYLIIDGQQRLTTIFILFRMIINEVQTTEDVPDTLINKIHEMELIYFPKGSRRLYTVDYDDKYFNKIIINPRNCKHRAKRSSQRNIQDAMATFEKQLGQEERWAIIEKLITVIENAIITTHVVEYKSQAAQIYMLQNNRGKKISLLESLKALLIYHIYLNSENTSYNVKLIEEKFSLIFKHIVDIKILDEDTILWFFTQAFIDNSDYSISLSVEKIKETLLKQDRTYTKKWIDDICKKLERAYDNVRRIEKQLHDNPKRLGDILYLNEVNDKIEKSIWPLILKIFHYNKDTWNDDDCLKLIEISLFTTLLEHRGTNRYRRIAYEYNENNINGLLKILLDVCEKGFYRNWNTHLNIYSSRKDRKLQLYLLWKYENDLRKKKGPEFLLYDEFTIDEKDEKYTIEHILPQTPWEGAVLHYDANEREIYQFLDHIGNLTILPQKYNSTASNKKPTDKIKDYKICIQKVQYQNLSKIIHLMEKKRKWWKEEIEKRDGILQKFADRYWNPQIRLGKEKYDFIDSCKPFSEDVSRKYIHNEYSEE